MVGAWTVPDEVKAEAERILEQHKAAHRGSHMSFAVHEALVFLNGHLQGFGVEGALPLGSLKGGFAYVNMGRSELKTVVYDHLQGGFRWGVSWEDVLTEHERLGVVYP